MLTIGWSDFALKNSTFKQGNSYSTLPLDYVIELVERYWDLAKPGMGEGENLNRKILVPILDTIALQRFYCPPTVKLQLGMPIRAEVFVRQDGEAPYVQTFITPEDAVKWGFEPIPAKKVDIVCYSAEALLENGGTRSTNCDFEIITILCSTGMQEPMHGLAMARNFLEKPGGTKGIYTAQEFAEAIWYWSNQGVRVKEPI